MAFISCLAFGYKMSLIQQFSPVGFLLKMSPNAEGSDRSWCIMIIIMNTVRGLGNAKANSLCSQHPGQAASCEAPPRAGAAANWGEGGLWRPQLPRGESEQGWHLGRQGPQAPRSWAGVSSWRIRRRRLSQPPSEGPFVSSAPWILMHASLYLSGDTLKSKI